MRPAIDLFTIQQDFLRDVEGRIHFEQLGFNFSFLHVYLSGGRLMRLNVGFLMLTKYAMFTMLWTWLLP